MGIRKQTLESYLFALLLTFLVPLPAVWALPASGDGILVHHDLSVVLTPASHEMTAEDRIELEIDEPVQSLTFTLARTLEVKSIAVETPSMTMRQERSSQLASFTIVQSPDTGTQRVVVMLPKEHGRKMTLVWVYRGLINDPPREPRHLRFVTPSETAGHIGTEGVYLSGGKSMVPRSPGFPQYFSGDCCDSGGVDSGWIGTESRADVNRRYGLFNMGRWRDD